MSVVWAHVSLLFCVFVCLLQGDGPIRLEIPWILIQTLSTVMQLFKGSHLRVGAASRYLWPNLAIANGTTYVFDNLRVMFRLVQGFHILLKSFFVCVSGILTAAFDCQIEYLLVKGIADFTYGAQFTSDTWCSCASLMAASLVTHVLSDPAVFRSWPHYDGNYYRTIVFFSYFCCLFPILD